MADPVFERWFDARALYRDGVPCEVTTALAAFPRIRDEVEAKIAWIAPRRALEIGPGCVPLVRGVPWAATLDLAPRFLAGGARRGVQADALRAPFRDDAFDLVVASDVLTHVRAANRAALLAEAARLAPRVLVFNPEPGTPEVAGSAVPTDGIVRVLALGGATVQRRDFVARAEGRPDFRMALVYAVRGGHAPRAGAG